MKEFKDGDVVELVVDSEYYEYTDIDKGDKVIFQRKDNLSPDQFLAHGKPCTYLYDINHFKKVETKK